MHDVNLNKSIKEINDEIQSYAMEEERLKKRLSLLSDKKNTNVKSFECMELALKQAQKNASFIREKCDKEIHDKMQSAKKRIVEYNNEIKGIEGKIKNKKQYIVSIMQSLFVLTEDKETNSFNIADEVIDRIDIEEEVYNNEDKKNNGEQIQQLSNANENYFKADDINQARNKYIVGKSCVKDLYDSRGNLIIKKDEVITEKIIEKAIEHEVFFDLILSMM